MEKPRDRGPNISPRRHGAGGHDARNRAISPLPRPLPLRPKLYFRAHADRTDYRKRLVHAFLPGNPRQIWPGMSHQARAESTSNTYVEGDPALTEKQTRKKVATPWSTVMFTLVAGVAFGVVIAVALAYRYHFGTAVSPLSSEWNNFGTFFGGLLGPILSMLAFFALVYTIFLQEQQLSIARSTLKAADEDKELTRKQLDAAVETQTRTADALALQNRLASDQSTRSAFFEMISLHNQIVQDTAFKVYEPIGPGIPPEKVLFEGRKGFRYFYEKVFEPTYSAESKKNDQLGPSKRSLRQFDRFLFGELNAAFSVCVRRSHLE